MKLFKKYYYWLIIVVSFVFLFISIFNAQNDALTFDEVAHIPAGYSYLTLHDMRLNPEHPPLIKDLAAFPLLFQKLRFNIEKDFWKKDINGQWEAGHDLLWQENNDPDKIAFWSRLPIIIISLLLGLFIFKWTKELAGVYAGLLAFLLYSFDPNILGHNHFVTTDIGIAAFLTFSFYYFVKFIVNPNWKNTFWGGIFLGLAHVAKFSSITLIPLYGLILFSYPLLKAEKEEKKLSFKNIVKKRLLKLSQYLLKGSVAFLLSFLIIWLVYLPSVWSASPQFLEKTIQHYIPRNTFVNNWLIFLNHYWTTRPFSEYGLGLAMVFQRVAGGNGAYYFGQVSSQAFPSYFPVVFLMKETLAFLSFLFITFLAGLYFLPKICKSILNWLKPSTAKIKENSNQTDFVLVSLILLWGYFLLYSYISITGNLNIGLRHLFPVFPPLIILVAVTIIKLEKIFFHRYRVVYQTSIVILLALLILETLSAYPYYLSFFNKAVGGPKNGYHYVTDSNADWGQDLKRLKKWLDQYPEIKKIKVDYFGGGNPQYYLGNRFEPWWDSKRPIESGYYAISTNFLMGSLYDKEKKDNQSYRWILKNNLHPIYQIGTSILVYYISPQEEKTIQLSHKIRKCPEEWIINAMPTIQSKENQKNKEYFIYKGKSYKKEEFDLDWVKNNCEVKKIIAY